MSRPTDTPENTARRQRAYELYLAVDDEGRRMSLRAIAMKLGVTVTAVTYWRTKDNWDVRLAASLDDSTRVTEASNGAVRTLLRASMSDHIRALNEIIADKTVKATDRIHAVREFARLAKELAAMTPEAPGSPGASTSFRDDMPALPAPAQPADPPTDTPEVPE